MSSSESMLSRGLIERSEFDTVCVGMQTVDALTVWGTADYHCKLRTGCEFYRWGGSGVQLTGDRDGRVVQLELVFLPGGPPLHGRLQEAYEAVLSMKQSDLPEQAVYNTLLSDEEDAFYFDGRVVYFFKVSSGLLFTIAISGEPLER